MFRSRVLALTAGCLLAATLAPGAMARSNVGGTCGSDANGFERVTIEGWWQRTVEDGFGGDLALAIEVLAPLLGVAATEDAVSEAIMSGVDATWDKNGNDHVCMKDMQDTPGLPTYIFNGKDDASSAGE